MLLIVDRHLLVVVAQRGILFRIEQHKAAGEDVLDIDDSGARGCLYHKHRMFWPRQLNRLWRGFDRVAGRQVVDRIVDHLLGKVQVDSGSPLLLRYELSVCAGRKEKAGKQQPLPGCIAQLP